MPKRVQVLYNLIRYLVKDYLTLVITAILLATLWRTLNTLEILGTYALRYKLFRCFCCKKKQAELVDFSVKDISAQMKLYREFMHLLRDLLVLLPIMFLTFLFMIRAKPLYLRLRRMQLKKKEKREIQALIWMQTIQRIIKTRSFEEEQPPPLNDDLAKRKKITDLNKNVMSVLLPYLEQPDILKVEGCNRKMSVFASFWPVWKNIYSEQHLKDGKIPKEVKDMTEEEQRHQDYRGACKRCYINLQS